MSKCSASWAIVRSPLTAASATFALKAAEWFRRGRLFMVSPVHGDYRRCQAEIPLIVLSRFPGPALGSLDTRNSVAKIVSDDNSNKLVNYAVKNSSSVAAMVGDTKSEAEKIAIWEKARQGAVYRLDDTVLMNSRNRAAQEVTCIGLLYVTVADATAQKELEFKVKQTADGKIIVSVSPFLF